MPPNVCGVEAPNILTAVWYRTLLPSVWQSLIEFCGLKCVCEARQWRKAHSRKAGENSGPILSCLSTKVHIVFKRYIKDPLQFATHLPYCPYIVTVVRLFPRDLRPIYMSADLYFTWIHSFFFFSSATRGARWTELNQNRPHARKWVRFEKVCPKNVGYPSPKIGSPKTTFKLFRRLRNFTGNLTAYISSEWNTIYIIAQVH